MLLQVCVAHIEQRGDMYLTLLIFILLVEDDDMAEIWHLVLYQAYLGQLCPGDHDASDLAMHEPEEEVVALLELDRKGHIDCTGIEHRKLADNPHVTSLTEERHILTLPDAESLETCSETIDKASHLRIGCGAVRLSCFL